MNAPVVAAPPFNPITIDPGVAYPYVIPSQGETSLFFYPVAGFTLAQSGRTLTVTYTGKLTVADQNFSINVFASNAGGTVSHTINFLVKGLGRSVDCHFNCAVGEGSVRFYFNTTISEDISHNIGDNLPLGRKLQFGALIPSTGTSDGAIDSQTLFVRLKTPSGFVFHTSATLGGSEIAAAHTGAYPFAIAFAQNGSDQIYVRDSSPYKVNDPVIFTWNDGTAMPTNLVGQLYVKEIVDNAYIKVAATVGGAAIVANADAFPADADTVVLVDTGGRLFPAITSGESTSVALNASLDYPITADIDPDRFLVEGLPAGLALAGSHITGTPSEAGWFPVIILAELGANTSYRYWLLSVGIASGDSGIADQILDLKTLGLYSPSGASGRASVLNVTLGDVPQKFGIQVFGDDSQLPAGAQFKFGIKPKGIYNAGTYLLEGSVTLTGNASVVSAGEDWGADGLLALFTNQDYLDFTGQIEWRYPDDPADRWRKSLPFTVRVWNNIFRDDTASPGARPSASPYFYWSWITRLTGGVSATDLDAQPIGALPDRTLVRVVTDAEGDTTWRKEAWEGADDPVSDTAAGRVVTSDYDNVTNRYVLIQKS